MIFLKEKKKQTFRTIDLCYIALFSAIISVCAWITVPTTIPFTLQTMGIYSSLLILGGRRGTLAILIYLFLGAVGLPVFAGGTGGIGRILGSSGGYLLGYLLIGAMFRQCEAVVKEKVHFQILNLILGTALCYLVGTIWFMEVYAKNVAEISLEATLVMCVTPFIIPDLIKIFLATSISKRLRPFVK